MVITLSSSSGSSTYPAFSSSSDPGTITIPLTTIFTPPEWCKSRQYTYSGHLTGTSIFTHNWIITGSTIECYPPGFPASKSGTSEGIYSPGICPSGWYATPVGRGAVSTIFESLCCPQGMTIPPHITGDACVSFVATPTTLALGNKKYTKKADTFVAEWPIWIELASKDLDVFTPASAPLHAITDPATARSKATTPQQTKPSAQGGISERAELGTGVSSAVVVLAIIALLATLFIRWKRARQHKTTVRDHTAFQVLGPDSTGTCEIAVADELWRDMAAPTALYEMSALAKPVEMVVLRSSWTPAGGITN